MALKTNPHDHIRFSALRKLRDKVSFRIRSVFRGLCSTLQLSSWRLRGLKVGKGTRVGSRTIVVWPHQVSVGDNCTIEHHVYFKFDGIWSQGPSIVIKDNVFVGSACEFNIRVGITIGSNSLIASGCRFIDHDHGISRASLMREQPGIELPIVIMPDVWIGCNCVVLKGVTIGQGAILAAGAVATKSIPEYEIWAGVPAKKIGDRSGD